MALLFVGYAILSVSLLLALFVTDFKKSRWGILLSCLLGAVSVAIFAVAGRINWEGIAIITLTLSSSIVGVSLHLKRHWVSNVFFTLAVILAVVASIHQIPGVQNVMLYPSLQVSMGGIPVNIMANFDKPLAAIAIFVIVYYVTEKKQKTHDGKELTLHWLLLPLYVMATLLTGWLLGLGYEFKLPEATLAFMVTNLLFSTITEEVFFRGLIQEQCYRYLSTKTPYATPIALLIASTIFGLAHSPGGMYFVFLATVSGVFYGLAYHTTGKLSAAILAHSGVNVGHFIFLEYPVPV